MSAGVLFWGDAGSGKIETASINGGARRPVLLDEDATYYAFVLYDGKIYFTDWNDKYAFWMLSAKSVVKVPCMGRRERRTCTSDYT